MKYQPIKHWSVTYWLTPFLMVLSVCVSRPCFAGALHHAGDLAAIRQILGTYEIAWNRHDAHAFSLIFTPDAQFVNVRGIAYPGGRAGIERAHRPLFAAMFKDSRVTTDRVRVKFVQGNVATADVYWRMTGARDRSGRLRGLVRGLRNMVLTKTAGHWQIAVFHNMEIDAPSPIGPSAGEGISKRG